MKKYKILVAIALIVAVFISLVLVSSREEQLDSDTIFNKETGDPAIEYIVLPAPDVVPY